MASISYLLQNYLDGTATPAELSELHALVQEPSNEKQLLQLLENGLSTETVMQDYAPQAFQQMIDTLIEVNRPRVKIMPLWKRLAAACILILLIGAGVWHFVFDKHRASPPSDVATSNDVIAPQKSRAAITLSDGKVIPIDSLNVLQQGSVSIQHTVNGQIIYAGTETNKLYNTLTNPRGSTVADLVLSDGSHVWLNAGSSITYPVSFAGNDRTVSVTGESYFEVAHDAHKPFIVSKGNTSVTVLGTHFNVNAFEDEPAIKVTLLEGSVRISSAQRQLMLTPGQQAEIDKSEITLHPDVNVEAVMSWKNGYFNFNGADIREVMKQLSRWYDLEVVYEGSPKARAIRGKMEMNLNLSQVMNILTKLDVHYKSEGRKLTILP